MVVRKIPASRPTEVAELQEKSFDVDVEHFKKYYHSVACWLGMVHLSGSKKSLSLCQFNPEPFIYHKVYMHVLS